MKALTLRQPWASLIVHGVKTIETRSWKAPDALIGERIAIHAARHMPADMACWEAGAYALARRWAPDHQWVLYRHAIDVDGIVLPEGAVVATATLAACVPIVSDGQGHATYLTECDYEGDLPHQQGGLWIIGVNALTHGTPTRVEDQRPFGDFTPGRWAWLLADVDALEVPIPAKGRLGLWQWEAA